VKIIFIFIFFCLSSYAESEPSAFPRLKWKGDFRFRGQREINSSDDPRLSTKLRFRLGLQAEIDPSLKAEIRLATTRTNNSTNQTLGDKSEPGPVRRFIGLDLAYAQWKPVLFFELYAGRIPQVHFRPGSSQILLDSDLALEGIAVASEAKYNDMLSVFANFGSTWIRENYDSFYSQEQTDNMLNWGQAGTKLTISTITTTFGLGFFNYTALQGMRFSDVSTGGTSRGNSEDPAETFKNAYVPRQYFIDTKWKSSASTVGAFIEHLDNGETLDPHKAWWTGVSYKVETWGLQVAYGQIHSDAVPGIFTDSDFAGGTTNAKGFVITAQAKLRPSVSLVASQYFNQKQATTEEVRYDRTHLDLIVEFF